MKDDSLNDTQQDKGGYCPMCDKEYSEAKQHNCKYVATRMPDSVGKCDCDIGMCTHRANCRNNPLKASQDEMDKAVKNYGRIDFESKLVCEIWNEAIEAAAELFPYGEWEETNIAAKIRKLKK